MSVGTLQSSLETQANLAQTLLSGPLQMADQAMKNANVNMQMQMKTQEMANAQAVVAQMTGVGGQINLKV
ncbi:hypothetical protein LJC09_04025 [Desulfovibrio sp. OttesenSCG-928-F20]|nr:hypothetical protein [Desulfovibrio sp. OttesenSCG-928-M16]MDL2291252.1 hypothetical protein [Desulfovibrio sp. OttesenSCG-928-F20]